MSFEINAKITADASGFDAAMRKVQSQTEQLSSKLNHQMDGWQESMSGATAKTGLMHNMVTGVTGKMAMMFSVGAVANFTNHMMELGDKFQNLHLRTGISTTDLQNLAVVADQTNVPLESMINGIERLGIAQAKAKAGDKEMEKTLMGLGLSKSDIAQTDKLLENFTKVGESVKGRTITGELDKSIKDVFGKSGTQFLQPFQSGFADKMRDMGLSGVAMDPHKIANFAELNDAKVKTLATLKATAGTFIHDAGEMFTDLFSALFSGRKIADTPFMGMPINMPGTWSEFKAERERQRERDKMRAHPDLYSPRDTSGADMMARAEAVLSGQAPGGAIIPVSANIIAKREQEKAAKQRKEAEQEQENAAKFDQDMAEAKRKTLRAGMTTDKQRISSLREEIAERERLGPEILPGMNMADYLKADRKFKLDTEGRKAQLAQMTRSGAVSDNYITDSLAKIGGYTGAASKMESLAERTAVAAEEIAKNTEQDFGAENYGF